MHTESSESRAAGGARLERAIVLLLLSDDLERRWSRAELGAELDAAASLLDAALRSLQQADVVWLVDEGVSASPAARRLDELELIGI
jgi:hypothetical protein